MTKYILTSLHYTGAVMFEYDKRGLMVFYSVLDADLNETQLLGLLRKLPREEADLQKLNESGYFTVKNLAKDLSFETFWLNYDKKIHPHRCEPIWNKMSDVQRLAALEAIPAYTRYLLKTGVAKANPENYLKRQYWKTDWSKEV